MERVKLRPFISEEAIRHDVRFVASEVNDYFDSIKASNVTILGVLQGGCMFTCDLARELSGNLIRYHLDFCTARSYAGTAKKPGGLKWSMPKVRGTHVLLVDDILDTGETLHTLTDHLIMRGKQVVTAVFLNRLGGHPCSIRTPLFQAQVVESSDWYVGYGMDYNGKYRNLPDIRTLEKMC